MLDVSFQHSNASHRLGCWQDLHERKVVLVIRRGRVVVDHRGATLRGSRSLSLHPESAVNRRQVLLHHRLIWTYRSQDGAVPIRSHAKYPGIVSGGD